MKKIYKLTPACKDNIWGGNKLRKYGKESDKDRIAESWELSFTDGGEARVEDEISMLKLTNDRESLSHSVFKSCLVASLATEVFLDEATLGEHQWDSSHMNGVAANVPRLWES